MRKYCFISFLKCSVSLAKTSLEIALEHSESLVDSSSISCLLMVQKEQVNCLSLILHFSHISFSISEPVTTLNLGVILLMLCLRLYQKMFSKC